MILNRGDAYHALDLDMVRKITPRLKSVDNNIDTFALILKHQEETRGFCAGGDVKTIWELGQKDGNKEEQMKFFREEYQMNYLTSLIKTPYIPYMNGITMGGGVGLSVHSRFRVASEQTMFAMPETAIGFFPDVGGSHFLPRLQGELGMYLGLTGARLKGYDTVHAGIATHYISSRIFPLFEERMSDGLGSLEHVLHTIDSCHQISYDLDSEDDVSMEAFSLEPFLESIDHCFSADSVEQIVERLDEESKNSNEKIAKWAAKTKKTLAKMSPTSLKVTFQQLRKGAKLSLADCLRMEYRIASNFLDNKDFYEGVGSALVTKTHNPQWSAALTDVNDATVAKYFDLPTGEEELVLPSVTDIRMPRAISPTYDISDMFGSEGLPKEVIENRQLPGRPLPQDIDDEFLQIPYPNRNEAEKNDRAFFEASKKPEAVNISVTNSIRNDVEIISKQLDDYDEHASYKETADMVNVLHKYGKIDAEKAMEGYEDIDTDHIDIEELRKVLEE